MTEFSLLLLIFKATKIVQAERNGKKNSFFLAFLRRSLSYPSPAGE